MLLSGRKKTEDTKKNKMLLSRVNESPIDFVIVKNAKGGVSQNEAVETQTFGFISSFEKSAAAEGFPSLDFVAEIIFNDRIRKEDDGVVLAVENCVQDEFLTVIENIELK